MGRKREREWERVRISLLFSEIGWEVFSDAHLLESDEVEEKLFGTNE